MRHYLIDEIIIFIEESANQLEQIRQGFEDPARKEARTLENTIAKYEELQAQYIYIRIVSS